MIDLDLTERKRILGKVSHLVETKHFNPSLNGTNWKSLLAERSDRILSAIGADQFEKEIQSLLGELHTSHTGFFHKSGRTVPARHAINATFKACQVDGIAHWVFQDVHEGGTASLLGIEPGDVLVKINGEPIAPPVQPVFKMATQTEFTIRKRDGKVFSAPAITPKPISGKRPIAEPKALSVSRLSDDIGYIKIRIFPGAVGIDLAADIDRAVVEISDCNRLILELRGNTGGGIGGMRMMSYLTQQKIPIGYSLTRQRAERGFQREGLTRFCRIPRRKIALAWLIIRYASAIVDQSICLMTEGMPPQKFHGRVVILVNEHSASAAEMLAAFAQENRLATIVGARTAGRLLSGRAFHLGNGYVLGLPVAAYFTWNGALLEGTGLKPDVEIEMTCEALQTGSDVQLDRAIEEVKRL
ncbi:MAG TPA: S41 family peptidase [Terriglobales bacterium]|jgi:carboxyl-terminal processing protease|nr:S41 family peptidase [Terriglobales bacterium]